MRRFLRAVLAALMCTLALSGCVSTKSFLDPGTAPVAYSEIRKSATPLRLRVDAAFQRNGVPRPQADGALKIHATLALTRSGAVQPVFADGDGEIRIVVNNVADLTEAASKGFVTGLTLGLAASTVVDVYEGSATVTLRGRTFHATARQTLHTLIGRGDLPPNAQALTSDTEFGRVAEQLTLRLLRDLQRNLP